LFIDSIANAYTYIEAVLSQIPDHTRVNYDKIVLFTFTPDSITSQLLPPPGNAAVRVTLSPLKIVT
jgi:hypothetical protein